MEELTVRGFRESFPEFASTSNYPDRIINFRLKLASKLCGRERWGDLWEMGCYLYTAHFMAALGGASAGAGQAGFASGASIASKSVDGMSVSYDNSQGAEVGAGVFNTTAYGREYARLRRMMGLGALLI